jgi:hypothetical protein
VIEDEEPVMQDQPPHPLGGAAVAPEAPAQAGEPHHDLPLVLPPRPRRRLLSPLPLALLGVLLLACGFIAGVLIEKGQTASGTGGAPSAGASRFAGLRSSSRGSTGAGGAAFAGAPTGGAVGGSGSATIGAVSFVEGKTLYVTDTEGNTVKVLAGAATITKTVSSSAHGIHPGETVIVSGKAAASGTVTAESIRVGSSGAAGVGSLPGGSGSSTGGGSSGGLKLFGSGG